MSGAHSDEKATHRMGGVWGFHISFNGTDILYREERRGLLRRKRSVPYRLVYGHGTNPKVGDLLDTRLGLHRLTEVKRCRDPQDMWTGRADVLEAPLSASSPPEPQP